ATRQNASMTSMSSRTRPRTSRRRSEKLRARAPAHRRTQRRAARISAGRDEDTNSSWSGAAPAKLEFRNVCTEGRTPRAGATIRGPEVYIQRQSGKARKHFSFHGTMRIILPNPRGFCAGVRMAVDVIDQVLALFPGRTIYAYHEIVHNKHVVGRFKAAGVAL